MKIAVFSTKKWVQDSFAKQLKTKLGKQLDVTYFEPRLNEDTVSLANSYDAVCVFVNDVVNEKVIDGLAKGGTKLIALRCSGFNNVDLKRAKEKGIGVVRVPAYSPYAIAEHAVGLILSLTRKFHRAHNRVREGNFSLDGLLGFDLHGKTVGVIGTGKIGQIFINIMRGFGCRILAFDKYPNKDLIEQGVEYAELDKLYRESDIISLHCPLMYDTYHIINEYAINNMKDGVVIINTSRGPLIDTNAVIAGIKKGRVGYLGLDVYEEEDDLFFEDMSDQVIQDDMFVRLQTFPNVLITAHQAFFTREAVDNIAETTFKNVVKYLESGSSENQVLPENAKK